MHQSERLRYRPVEPGDLDAFHRLVQDAHVRRYLMDGAVLPREWSEGRIRDSQALFTRRGVGLWLAHDRITGALVGFCGFVEFAQLHPEPQLVYAMSGDFAGKGLGTEMARASIAAARAQQGFATVVACVDEPNVASMRVLEKVGFRRVAILPGHFGCQFLLELDGNDGSRPQAWEAGLAGPAIPPDPAGDPPER